MILALVGLAAVAIAAAEFQPWHGAQFDVTTGAVLGPPAPQAVSAYKVLIEGDSIVVEVA